MEMASAKDDGSSSSSEHELAEAMESSLLGKRKAEEDEDGVESESEEEEEDDDSNTEPEWGYDSFEGREYNDSVIPRQYSDEEREMQCRYYHRHLIETKGFLATTDGFPPRLFSIAALRDLEQPAMLGLTVRQACEKLASLCLERYNQDEGKNVKLDHVLRVNYNPSHMTKYYITFAARETESQDEPLVEYQAKAVWSVTHKKYPHFLQTKSRTRNAVLDVSWLKAMEESTERGAKLVEEIS